MTASFDLNLLLDHESLDLLILAALLYEWFDLGVSEGWTAADSVVERREFVPQIAQDARLYLAPLRSGTVQDKREALSRMLSEKAGAREGIDELAQALLGPTPHASGAGR